MHQVTSHRVPSRRKEKRRKVNDAADLIRNYLSGSRYAPKRAPKNQVKRSSIYFLYSFNHYARPEWYEHLKKAEEEAEKAKQNQLNIIRCNYCNVPETSTKHKICSACKKAYYCSAECQKHDWKRGHKEECKKNKAK